MTIAYPDLATIPAELRDAITSRGSINVYRMVTHSPGLAPAFLKFASAVFQADSLPAHLRELAILRVGHSYGAAYEVHHHGNIARWVGLSDSAALAAATGVVEGLSDEEVAILHGTDELLANHTLAGVERDAVLQRFTVGQLADLVLTVGFYQLVCNFLNTFEVTTEGEGVQP
jgi:4-carboxymuconolactone decarboxylase